MPTGRLCRLWHLALRLRVQYLGPDRATASGLHPIDPHAKGAVGGAADTDAV